MYDIYLNGNLINETAIEFSYSEDLADVGTAFEFTSTTDYGITSEINGKKVINRLELCLQNTRTPVYVGYITDCEHTNNKDVFKHSGFDVGFYLKNNQVVKKFNGENIGTAIINLCQENNIGEFKNDGRDTVFSVNIPKFTQTIKKIYKGETFDEILKELLELEKTKGGIKDVYIDCKNGGLNIRRYEVEESLITPVAQVLIIDGFTTYNNVTVKHSIQKLRNRVIITDNANDKIIKNIQKKEDDSIATYGLLTHVEKVDTNKNNNLIKLAENKLAELNKVEESISLSILGDYRAGKGKIIPIELEEYNLTGKFLIKTAAHKIYENREEVDISIQRYKESAI